MSTSKSYVQICTNTCTHAANSKITAEHSTSKEVDFVLNLSVSMHGGCAGWRNTTCTVSLPWSLSLVGLHQSVRKCIFSICVHTYVYTHMLWGSTRMYCSVYWIVISFQGTTYVSFRGWPLLIYSQKYFLCVCPSAATYQAVYHFSQHANVCSSTTHPLKTCKLSSLEIWPYTVLTHMLWGSTYIRTYVLMYIRTHML